MSATPHTKAKPMHSPFYFNALQASIGKFAYVYSYCTVHTLFQLRMECEPLSKELAVFLAGFYLFFGNDYCKVLTQRHIDTHTQTHTYVISYIHLNQCYAALFSND